MIILALNAGSSSLKFAVIHVDGGTARSIVHGSVERFSASSSELRLSAEHHEPSVEAVMADDPTQALSVVLERLVAVAPKIDAVGHRVVLGGSFIEPARIDAEVLKAIGQVQALAPLHNNPSLAGIAAVNALLPDTPAVAVFDTAFHASMPDVAGMYGLPIELSTQWQLRRRGFHGLAHRSMTERYAEFAGVTRQALNIVTLQLGSGCSACAVRAGMSVDTSMGFTPAEGLVMGTRAGDIDASVAVFLQRQAGFSVDDIDDLINRRSGLLGLSGTTQDMRILLEAESRGDARARFAVEMFTYRVRKYIGAYIAVLNGPRAIIFGGAIGERSPDIRRRICEPLSTLGIALDARRNDTLTSGEGRIDSGTGLEVWVIPPDEQTIIARETFTVVEANGAGTHD